MKKLIAFLLTVMLCVSTVTPVSAAEGDVRRIVQLDQNGRAKYTDTLTKDNGEHYYSFTPSSTGTLKVITTGTSDYAQNCVREEYMFETLEDYPGIISPVGRTLTYSYTLAKGATYLIGTKNRGSAKDNEYTISFEFKSAKQESFPEEYLDQSEDMSDANAVDLNKTYYAVNTLGDDNDWFKFTPVSEAYINVTGNDIHYEVYDSLGKRVYAGHNYGYGYSKDTFYIKFWGHNKGEYSFCVEDEGAKEPDATSITKLTGGSDQFTVQVKERSATGYQVQYSLNSDFQDAATKTFKKTSVTVKDLKKNSKYYVRVRTYKKAGIKTLYSSWSAKKTVNTISKPKATSITKLSKGSKKFTVKVANRSVTGYQVQYSSKSNFKNAKTKTFKGTSLTVSSLKAKTKYYVRVRTYNASGSKKLYSSWSAKKTVQTK